MAQPTPTPRPVNINLDEPRRAPPKGPGLLLRTEKRKIGGVEYNVPIYSDGYGGELPTDGHGQTIFPKNARGEIEFQTPTGPQGMPAGTPPQQPTPTVEGRGTVTVPDPRTGRPMVYPAGHPQAGSPQLFTPDQAKDLTDVLDKQRKWESENDPVKKAAALAELEAARQKIQKSSIEIDYLPASLQATINRDVAATELAGAQTARARALLPGEVATQTYDIAGKAQALDLGQVNIDRLRTLSRNEALTTPGGLEDSVLYLDDLREAGLLSVADRDEMIAGIVKNAKVALKTGITDPAKRDEIERDWARLGIQVTAEERAGRAQTEVERRNVALEAQAREDSQRLAAESLLTAETTRRQQAATGYNQVASQHADTLKNTLGWGGTNAAIGFLGALADMAAVMKNLSQVPGVEGGTEFLAGLAKGGMGGPGGAPGAPGAPEAPEAPPPGQGPGAGGVPPEVQIGILDAIADDSPMPPEELDKLFDEGNPILALAGRAAARRAPGGLGFLGNLSRPNTQPALGGPVPLGA